MLHFALTSVDQWIWILTSILSVALVGLLLYGRHFRLYPCFTIYVAYDAARNPILALVHNLREPNLYFYAYYIGVVIGTAILILVAVEVAAEVFAPYRTIPIAHVINLVGGLVLVTIAALCVSEFAGYHPAPSFWNSILTLDKFTHFVVVGGLLLAVFISRRVGLPWHEWSVGVVAGVLFSLILQGVNLILTPPADHVRFHRPFGMLAFVIAQLVWLYTFRRGWVPPPPLTKKMVTDWQQKSTELRERLGLLTSISN